jgi:dihydrofolate synthase/folylpolyglutamate synthase
MQSAYEIIMPHWPQPSWREPEGAPLERMERLLEALGNPQENLPPTIHVAGTNGKGSTIAILRSIFEAAGLKVHSYTSPHIHRFHERIRLRGEEIEENYLHRLLETCRLANEEQPITFFEGTTAAALLAFSEQPADVLLVETGMGGTHDPTNIIPKARLNIITSISYDHMEHLGPTLVEIADHKAGIMRPETPVVFSFQEQAVTEQLEASANKLGALPVVYGKHWAVQKSADGFIYADAHGQIEFPAPALPGPHQLINAGNAIAALSILEEFEISAEQIAAGLRWVQWPGRLERITRGRIAQDLPEDSELWFDGGHNMAAGFMLSVHVQEYWADKPLYVVFGTTRGKPVAPMLEPLQPLATALYAVPVAAEPKCYTPQEIADQAEDGGIRMQLADSVEEAVEDIKAAAEGRPARILIFGSLYHRVELIV